MNRWKQEFLIWREANNFMVMSEEWSKMMVAGNAFCAAWAIQQGEIDKLKVRISELEETDKHFIPNEEHRERVKSFLEKKKKGYIMEIE